MNPPPRHSQSRMQTATLRPPYRFSAPTRIRTRNASFEARYDRPFHHRGVKRKARESNPHLRWENRLSRAARPTVSGYLPSVDPPGIEPGFPVCRTGVVPLDHEPIPFSGPRGSRTLISGVRSRRRPVGPAAQSVIPDGLEPSLPGCRPGVFVAGPRDRVVLKSGPIGNRTRISGLQDRRLPVGR